MASFYAAHFNLWKSFYPTEINIKFVQKKKKNQPNCYLFCCYCFIERYGCLFSLTTTVDRLSKPQLFENIGNAFNVPDKLCTFSVNIQDI